MPGAATGGEGRDVTVLDAPYAPPVTGRSAHLVRLVRWPGLRELVLVTLLYVAYSASRLVADDAVAPALGRAHELLAVERGLGLAWEQPLNRLFVDVDLLGLAASFQYATAHYVVTAVALVWLHRRGPAAYLPARRALLVATVAGLVLYLMVPMAPPRLTPEYVDVLRLHAEAGWWGAEASAPKGLGGLTNQLAAFPSLHAGWALWVALAVRRTSGSPVLRGLAWAHALVTAVVVVGTGNHWVLDVVAGWAVVVLGYAVADRWPARDRAVNTPPRSAATHHGSGPASLSGA
jgi:hypothetical protein